MTNPFYRDEDDRRPVVVFGNLASASLARYVLEHDSPYKVEAFTANQPYCVQGSYEGLPLVPFESLERFYKPDEVRLLIPCGYLRVNAFRRSLFESAKQRGYGFVGYLSSRASTWPNVRIGENVLVYEHAILQPFSSIGDNCIVRSGAHVSHHCEIGAHAFIAVQAAMGGKVKVGEQAVLGVGSVIVDSIEIAPRTFVGAGAVVTQSTHALGVYVGNPARKLDKSALEI